MNRIGRVILSTVASMLLWGSALHAQMPQGTEPKQPEQSDTAMIFQPIRPLMEQQETSQQSQALSSIGLSASFTDYGVAGGLFFRQVFSDALSADISLDVSPVKGSREFGTIDEITVNRIFILPLMASAEYRLFRTTLSEGFRPYVTAGVGSTLLITTSGSESFLPAFKDGSYSWLPSGFIGVGARFGSDRSAHWGASARFFVIPHSDAIQSTTFQSVSDMSGLFLSLSYSFNL